MHHEVERPSCPLCAAVSRATFLEDLHRHYFRCAECDLVFIRPGDRPGHAEESHRYREHENARDDAGYVAFLRQLADPLFARVPVGARGLDVGCGPVPVLAEFLSAGGRPTAYYDPLFFPDGAVLREPYDFVTCTEVVEHAHDPSALFAQLVGLLRPGGILGVMTLLLDESIDFGTWWYRRDVTHVCFYSARTMAWVGAKYGMSTLIVGRSVVLIGGKARELQG